MGKANRYKKKILIREAQHYQMYTSKTRSRRKNRNQLRKGEMKERIEYEITRNHGKISDREMLLLLQRELMKEEQFEEERYEPEYSITEVNKIIKYRCTRCNGKSKWHGCVIKREGKIMG
jgi:hypothetical protein